MRDFRLPPRCKWNLRYFGILRSVERWFLAHVSEQSIGPIFKGQTLCLATQNVTDRFPQDDDKKLPF